MKQYPDMKDSGVAWIGEVPRYWDTVKIKYLFKERSEKGYPDEPLLVASQNMGVVPKSIYGNRTVEAMKELHLLKLVRVGDFVISLRSFQGGIEYAHYQGIISPAYTILIPKEIKNTNYFRYLLKSCAFISVLKECVTGIREGQNIDYQKLKNFKIPIPSLPEQDQIVRFLDWKVSCINKMVSIKKRQIDELRDLKTFYISKAVTNGVDDNGIISDAVVAQSWDRVKIGYKSWIRARLGWRGLKATEYVEEGYPFLSAFNIVNDKLSWENLNFINQFRYDESPEIKLSIGDIILVKDGAGIGKCARIDELPCGESTTNSSLAVITPDDDLSYKYLYYYLVSNDFKNATNRIITGMGVPHLTQHFLKNVEVPCPPIGMQEKIAEFLDAKCAKIDAMISIIESEIHELKELRSRLVADVVTGKIDVHDTEIPEYEFTEEEPDAGIDEENEEESGQRED